MKIPRMSYEISISDRDDSADAALVAENLRIYIEEKFGPANKRPFVAVVHGPDKTVLGGLKGFSHWRWLYVVQLWVKDEARSLGLGQELLAAAEKEALKRGDRGLYVDTFEENTRKFYLKNGFKDVGEIRDFPVGSSRYFLAKHL